MNGGISGYEGYSYQTLSFFYKLLLENNCKSGELEKEDDFLIINNNDEYICYQCKNYNSKLTKTHINKIINTFFEIYKKKEKRIFVIFSSNGINNNIKFNEIVDDLEKNKKISFKNEKDKINFITSLKSESITKTQLFAEIKLLISDIIHNEGGAIPTKDTEKIIDKIIGNMFRELKQINRDDLIEEIKKYSYSYMKLVPSNMNYQSTDISKKYSIENFDNQIINDSITSNINFLIKKKRLSQVPSVEEQMDILINNIADKLKEKNLNQLKLEEFSLMFDSVYNSNYKFSILEDYYSNLNELKKELFNELIGICILKPKK